MAGNSFHVAEGNGGLQKVVVTHESGDALEVYLKGASVVSWKNAKGDDYFYVSPKSYFDAENPIRGGIPLAFPQFGLGDLPRHGFARLETWEVTSQETLKDGSAALVLSLRDTEWTRGLWNHEFALEYTVILRKSRLVTQFMVTNTGATAFDFAFLFHTYFSISDLNAVKITGFEGYRAMDKIAGSNYIISNEPMEFGSVNRETCLHVCDTRGAVVLNDPGARRSVTMLSSVNCTETVIWNPHSDVSIKTEDLADDGYKKFICIEPGAFFEKTALTPGESAIFSQTITVKEEK